MGGLAKDCGLPCSRDHVAVVVLEDRLGDDDGHRARAAYAFPDVMRSLALTPSGTPASVLAADVASDYAYWGKLVSDLGIKFE